jgi:type IV secretion system protein VirB1
MPLPIAMIMALSHECAPATSPKTLTAVVLAESGGDPLAIGVNGAKPHRLYPRDAADAVATANRLLASGANFDLGLGQINSKNLGPLGLSVSEAFDPCHNLASASQVLAADYGSVDPTVGEQGALRTSFSLYNTGTTTRGFRNGYVAKVIAAARLVVPAIAGGIGPTDVTPSPPAAPTPSWEVFARAATTPVFVIDTQTAGDGQ